MKSGRLCAKNFPHLPADRHKGGTSAPSCPFPCSLPGRKGRLASAPFQYLAGYLNVLVSCFTVAGTNISLGWKKIKKPTRCNSAPRKCFQGLALPILTASRLLEVGAWEVQGGATAPSPVGSLRLAWPGVGQVGLGLCRAWGGERAPLRITAWHREPGVPQEAPLWGGTVRGPGSGQRHSSVCKHTWPGGSRVSNGAQGGCRREHQELADCGARAELSGVRSVQD